MDGWLLPAGRHPATLAQIEERFVREAPFPDDRRPLFDALQLYADRVWKVAGDAPLWVNGGFVTHKPWAAPEDIDVVFVLTARQARDTPMFVLGPLCSAKLPSGGKSKAMGGLIDGFCIDGRAALERYWDGLWSSVTDEHKVKIEGLVKGYLEVRRSE